MAPTPVIVAAPRLPPFSGHAPAVTAPALAGPERPERLAPPLAARQARRQRRGRRDGLEAVIGTDIRTRHITRTAPGDAWPRTPPRPAGTLVGREAALAPPLPWDP